MKRLPTRHVRMLFVWRLLLAVLVLLGSFFGTAHAERVVTDMAGRKVVVAEHIVRSSTVGAGPVLDSFLAALGVGRTLINGMPFSARLRQADCCRFLPRVIPGVLDLPVLENTSFQINRELLLNLQPDVVLLHSEPLARDVDDTGLHSFVVRLTAGRDANAVQVMAALGELYGRQERASIYARHFTDLLYQVKRRLKDVDDGKRQRAIYFNYPGLSLTSATADWWIEAAGAQSVTRSLVLQNGRADISIEQLLAWNPQVIFAATPREARQIAQDQRFSSIDAVRSGRIHAVPRSVIRWAHPSPEQAIGVLWAATKLYPDQFIEADVAAELRAFYRRFYQVVLTEAEVTDILFPSDPKATP